MAKDDTQHLYVDEQMYEDLIERLAVKVHLSGWPFEQILCLARGGMRPGDVLSRIFDKPLAVLSASSYRGEGGTQQGWLEIAHCVTTARNEVRGNLLLVDDLVDSGATLNEVVGRLRVRYPQISALRTAVLWVKGVARFVPDYSVESLPHSPWIHQPFERFEHLNMTELTHKWSDQP